MQKTIPPSEVESNLTRTGANQNDELVARDGSDVLRFAAYLMNLLNKPELGFEVYGHLLDHLMDYLGTGAAAIRLKLGEDFPFFVTRGFSDRFLEEDNFICVRDQSGNVTMDDAGRPLLKCFCGAVLSQDSQTSDAHFTGHGIFCANGPDQLSPANKGLHVESEAIKCFLEGYSALCLTPIKSATGISGLLILADTKPLRLTHELISLLQILSFGMGAAVDRLLEMKAQLVSLKENLETSISARKALEDSLASVNMQLEAVSEALADIVFFKDRKFRYTYVNSSMTRTFGKSREEIIGKTSFDLFSPQSAEQVRLQDLRVLAGETIEMESMHWIDGAQTYFQELKTPVKDPGGGIVGILGLVKNVTERKKAHELIGDGSLDYPSPAMRATMEKAAFAADTDSILLFQGESGSGKDHVARWIHEHSKRSSGPFLGINCAALPHELAESELFGHEQGAFTGAKARKRGLLELAESGTLLLNEIGELSLSLQAKLLSFLDTRSFMRVGGEKSIKVNARIMAATHRDLKEEVAEGRFERALFYRLNVFSIAVPPLRERLEDLPILIQEMISKLGQEIQLHDIPEISPDTILKLAQYDWPGNVRELRNVLERGLILSRGPQFVLPAPLVDTAESWSHRITFPEQKDLNELMREIRTSLCNEALRRTDGARSRAAKMLGISRDAFYRYLKERPHERN